MAVNSQQLPVNSEQLPVESNYLPVNSNSSPNLKPNSSKIPHWQETQVNTAQKSQNQDQINIESSPVMDSNLLSRNLNQAEETSTNSKPRD